MSGPSRPLRHWRRFELGYLRARAAQGMSGVEIARRLRRTRGAVYEMAKKHGIALRRLRSQPPCRPPASKSRASKRRSSPRRRWSASEDADLRKARDAGEEARAVAARLGRSVAAVHTRMVSLGIAGEAGRSWSAAEDRRLSEGWARGEAGRAIAAALGRSHWGVFARARLLGLTAAAPRRRAWRRFEIAYIRARAAQGWSAAEIARRLRRDGQAVRDAARTHAIVLPKGKPGPPASNPPHSTPERRS